MKQAFAAKSRSRKFVVQALYQAHMTSESPDEVAEPFIAEHNMKRADIPYFREMMCGIGTHADRLTEAISAPMDRGIDELDPVVDAILRLGAFELMERIDIPYKVVINEAIELAKTFGPTDSQRYVNSILDVIAHEHRAAEAMNRDDEAQ